MHDKDIIQEAYDWALTRAYEELENNAWEEAHKLALARAYEKDIYYDDDIIEAWTEEYYDYLTNQRG